MTNERRLSPYLVYCRRYKHSLFPLLFLMKNTLTAAAFLTLVAMASSCKKDEINNNYYAAPEEAKGSALGFVSLYDEFGHTLRRNDAVRVTVKGTMPLIEAVTDTNGRYQLDGLRAGNYLLTFSRPGYGAYEQEFMLAAAGGNQPVLVTQVGPYGPQKRQMLYQQATTVASNLQVVNYPNVLYDSDTVMVLKGTLTPGTTSAHPRAVAILFDSLAGVTKDNFIAGFLLSTYYGQVSGGTFRQAFTRYDLRQYYSRYGLFRPGQRFYARAYGIPAGGSNGYISRETGMYIYSSLHPQATNRVDFAAPQ
jgi:Carboxypeptidase regulatory-like domain